MIKTIIFTIFILLSFISFPLNASIAEAARFPGGAEKWHANYLKFLERPYHSPPPHPKPAPPERPLVSKESHQDKLHAVFFPLMAHGHMIPTLDTARLFAARGVKATIITTPCNMPIFTQAIEMSKENEGPMIGIKVFQFPLVEDGLPKGCENLKQAMSSLDMAEKFFRAASMLRQQLEDYLERARPHVLVADMFFPWATECAAKFNIPRLVFHGTSFFADCVRDMIMVHQPYKHASSDYEPFVIPSLPHEIILTRSQLPEGLTKNESELKKRHEMMQESEVQSYGVIFNSFYELEPDYADFFRRQLGRRAWHVGPVSLCNETFEEKAQRGGETNSIDEHKCLEWLNLKKPNSVIFLSFGSLAHFIVPQLQEIAMALEVLEYEFIWVVREDKLAKSEEWLPQGFKERTRGKGLMLGGWVPQLLILEHEAVGVFVTHCGWNSTLEAISTGVPMVTWPLFTEQFYNEKLVNEVLGIGTPVGAKKWRVVYSIEDVVKHDAIKKAVIETMEGDKAHEKRNKAKKLKDSARQAMEEGGSSYRDLSSLISELRDYHTAKLNNCRLQQQQCQFPLLHATLKYSMDSFL